MVDLTLDENYWFEDGYISKVDLNPEGLEITIGLQVKGTYVASESRTLREFVIKPIGLKT